MSDSASVVTYKQACLCRRSTATRGRYILDGEIIPGFGLVGKMALHPEPVCDACDTPWRKVPAGEDCTGALVLPAPESAPE